MDIQLWVPHASVNTCLSYFKLFASRNNTTINKCIQAFLHWPMFSFIFSNYLEVQLLSYMIILWLMNSQVTLQNTCTILHFFWQSMKVPISLYLHQYLLLPEFFSNPAILICMKWYLIVEIFFTLMNYNWQNCKIFKVFNMMI